MLETTLKANELLRSILQELKDNNSEMKILNDRIQQLSNKVSTKR